jgi:transposase-like protein
MTTGMCRHPQMPDLGGGNPLSFKQCPDCQKAVYWDNGWRISGIQLPPNSTDEQRTVALVSAAMRVRKMTLPEVKFKNASIRPLNCPHCGRINEWSAKKTIRCGHCKRYFDVKVGLRFRNRNGASLPTKRKAWEMFATGKRASEVKVVLNLGSDTAGKWHKQWRSGVELPD